MDADRWEATIAYTAATHGLSQIAGERFYRPELLPLRAGIDGRVGGPDVRRGARREAGPLGCC